MATSPEVMTQEELWAAHLEAQREANATAKRKKTKKWHLQGEWHPVESDKVT